MCSRARPSSRRLQQTAAVASIIVRVDAAEELALFGTRTCGDAVILILVGDSEDVLEGAPVSSLVPTSRDEWRIRPMFT